MDTTRFLKELKEISISDVIKRKECIVGLDIGDKTIGVATSDRRNRIATSLGLINRNSKNPIKDCEILIKMIVAYNPGLVIFGWPLQMDGKASQQCEKNLGFIIDFKAFLAEYHSGLSESLVFSKWDERLSTRAVTGIMIEADLSRRRRKEVVDKTAAVYILQGALDFMNKNAERSEVEE